MPGAGNDGELGSTQGDVPVESNQKAETPLERVRQGHPRSDDERRSHGLVRLRARDGASGGRLLRATVPAESLGPQCQTEQVGGFLVDCPRREVAAAVRDAPAGA